MDTTLSVTWSLVLHDVIADRSKMMTQDVTETEKQATNCSKQWEGEHTALGDVVLNLRQSLTPNFHPRINKKSIYLKLCPVINVPKFF